MASVVSSVASAAVLRREEDPPGGLRSHGTPGRFAPVVPLLPPAPPTVSCVPASRELVSGGPLPLPLRGGAQAPGRVSLLRTTAAAALYYDFSVALPCLPLQVEARNVAGGQKSFHLERQNAPAPDLRCRWNKKCPPATFCLSTCNVSRLHLLRFEFPPETACCGVAAVAQVTTQMEQVTAQTAQVTTQMEQV